MGIPYGVPADVGHASVCHASVDHALVITIFGPDGVSRSGAKEVRVVRVEFQSSLTSPASLLEELTYRHCRIVRPAAPARQSYISTA